MKNESPKIMSAVPAVPAKKKSDWIFIQPLFDPRQKIEWLNDLFSAAG
jgi:hypothetical protein